MEVCPDLDGELPLVGPSFSSLTACLMLQGHDLAVLLTNEVKFDGDIAIIAHRNHPTNFGIQHFDFVSVGSVLPGILRQGEKRIVGSLPFEPAISRFGQGLAVQLKELFIRRTKLTEGELVLVDMLQGFVPRLTKHQMVRGILPAPPKDVFIKELPRARAEGLKFGGVQYLPLIPERDWEILRNLQHRQVPLS